MKNAYRIITLFLAILFSVFSSASAETIDISNLTCDELIELRRQIDYAIAESNEWKQVVVPIGKYIVGIDIPAGDYTVVYSGDFQGSINTFTENGDLAEVYTLGDLWTVHTIGKVTLSEGMTVRVLYGELVFSPYKGLGF